MILPPALDPRRCILMMPVSDSVPTLNVEQVCQGIAQQGGVTFHDSAIGEEKKNCLDSEQAIRDQIVKEWSSFAPADKTACTNESRMGGEFELHRTSDLPGNGARRPGHAQRPGERAGQHPDPGHSGGAGFDSRSRKP